MSRSDLTAYICSVVRGANARGGSVASYPPTSSRARLCLRRRAARRYREKRAAADDIGRDVPGM